MHFIPTFIRNNHTKMFPLCYVHENYSFHSLHFHFSLLWHLCVLPDMSKLFLHFINLLETTRPRPRFIDHYSSELCVTAKHLSEVCKKVSGRTALQWITEFIENDIRHYLLHTDLSIKEIVYQLQFPNASFFGKYVRAHFGKSPSEFRRSTGTK